MKVKKVNRMTTEQITARIFDLEAGQTHVTTNSKGDEVSTKGGSHVSSKYYRHLREELGRRTK